MNKCANHGRKNKSDEIVVKIEGKTDFSGTQRTRRQGRKRIQKAKDIATFCLYGGRQTGKVAISSH